MPVKQNLEISLLIWCHMWRLWWSTMLQHYAYIPVFFIRLGNLDFRKSAISLSSSFSLWKERRIEIKSVEIHKYIKHLDHLSLHLPLDHKEQMAKRYPENNPLLYRHKSQVWSLLYTAGTCHLFHKHRFAWLFLFLLFYYLLSMLPCLVASSSSVSERHSYWGGQGPTAQ